jgi:hypothetical protein
MTWQVILTGIMIACTPSVIFMVIVLWKDYRDQIEDHQRGFGPD